MGWEVMSTRDEAVVELITQSMVTGFMVLKDRRDAIVRELDLHCDNAGDALLAVLGDYPAEFAQIRSDLVDAVLAPSEALS